MALTTEPLASTTAKIRPSTISEKYSGGPEQQRDAGERRAAAAIITVVLAHDHQRSPVRSCND